MTLSEGEKSLSVNLDAFQPSWRATQRVLALGGWGGAGGKVEGQRSTTAKRQIYWPRSGLRSPTSAACKHGPVPAVRPHLHGCPAAARAAPRSLQRQAAKDNKRGEVTWRAGRWCRRPLIRHLDSWERRSSAFVAAPPLSKYCKLFTPRRPFLSSSTLFIPSHFIQRAGEGGIAPRATEQTVEKGGCHLYPVPRRTCLFIFLFELQAVELSPEFDVRKLN